MDHADYKEAGIVTYDPDDDDTLISMRVDNIQVLFKVVVRNLDVETNRDQKCCGNDDSAH